MGVGRWWVLREKADGLVGANVGSGLKSGRTIRIQFLILLMSIFVGSLKGILRLMRI